MEPFVAGVFFLEEDLGVAVVIGRGEDLRRDDWREGGVWAAVVCGMEDLGVEVALEARALERRGMLDVGNCCVIASSREAL